MVKTAQLALLALVAACAPEFTSRDFRCEVPDGCPNDYHCVEGYCVSVDDTDGGLDVGPPDVGPPDVGPTDVGPTDTDPPMDTGTPAPDSMPADSGGDSGLVIDDATGTYFIAGSVSYICASAMVGYMVAEFYIDDSGSSLSVDTGSGLPCVMIGSRVGNSFSAMCIVSDACTLTFVLTGTFSTEDMWCGALVINATGDCMDCGLETRMLCAGTRP